MIIAGVGAYFGLSRLFGQTMTQALLQLPQRATTLLRFTDGLGIPFLAPLLKAVAGGQWSQVPTVVHSVLDQLDDKTLRRGILDNLLQAQITNRLGDPGDKEALLKFLEQKLGTTIPRS